jgi:hypothetical protein
MVSANDGDVVALGSGSVANPRLSSVCILQALLGFVLFTHRLAAL